MLSFRYIYHSAKWLVLLALLLSGLIVAPDARGRDRGPFYIRNQFPATLPFLGLHADDAYTLGLHQFRLAVRYSHSNTFVKSAPVVSMVSQNRSHHFTRQEASHLIAQSPEADEFLFDTETGRISLNLGFGLQENLTVNLEIPLLYHSGGIFDRMIEKFHHTFGFPDDKRPVFARNASQAFLYLDGQQIFLENRQFSQAGFGDVVLSTKFRILASQPSKTVLALATAIKFPTGSWRRLHGSGSMDYGINLLATHRFSSNALHINLGAVKPGPWQLMPELHLAPVYSMLLAFEHRISKNASFIIQDFGTTSIFRRATREAIARDSHEITAGIKMSMGQGAVWSFSATENYINYRNTPDIGFHLGLEKVM